MVRLAAERHSITARGAVIATRGLHQPLGHRDIAHAIRRFGKLDEDAIGDGHRLMHDPQGAGAPEARKLKACGGMPLGDIPSHVDTAEEEGNAPRTGALQR